MHNPFTGFRYSAIRLTLILLFVPGALALSGCISLANVGHSGTHLVDFSHKADEVVSAYLLPDGNIVLFVKGRLAEGKGRAEFSLLVPKETLANIKENPLKGPWGHVAQGDHEYAAMIGPPESLKGDGWVPLKTDYGKAAATVHAKADECMPVQSVPVVYSLKRAPDAVNGDGLRDLWGNIHIVYVDTYPDGTAFRCAIVPKAERITSSHNGLVWLPVTVPLDVVTLPAQVIWGALFTVSLAASASR